MTPGEFRKRVQYVRNSFFPQWDRTKKWRFRLDHVLDAPHDFCSHRTQTITVRSTIADEDVDLVLVHEIAHALNRIVRGDTHNDGWNARMEKAAQRAERLGDEVLAARLRKEVTDFRNAPLMTVRDSIEERAENPGLEYIEVVEKLATQMDMSPEELRKRYPLGEKWFKETQAAYSGW